MTDNTPPRADRQLDVLARYNANLSKHVKSLITESLIEEHRLQPLGQHSDAHERVLTYFRRPPRFALYSRKACREFQIIALPVAPGGSPEPVDAMVYTDENAAMNAVFLKHVGMLS
jgi:branched-chain amino acid transport system permease protein